MLNFKTQAAVAKNEVSGSSERLHTVEKHFQRISRDSRIRGTSQKVRNSKANCWTLLKRITKLKCVNSEFKSVDIDPEQGCLNWPYGTMSESP